MLLDPGVRFAGYAVVGLLGRGGSSEVYLVDDGIRADTTLKVLVGEAVRSRHACARLAREFDIARGLRHPNIVTMRRTGVEGKWPWLSMQYVIGYPASRLAPAPSAQPDVPLALTVLGCIASALDYVHSAGVVHRDVKPSNILVAEEDPPASVLTDFGIARYLDDQRPAGRDGRVVGSIPYVAPEALLGQKVGAAADQYGLACSIVEILTGKTPFPLATQFAIAYAHRETKPPQLSARRRWIPRRVDTVIARGMAKNPRDRYPSCAELVDAVSAALADARPDPPPPRRGGTLTLPRLQLRRR